jgi:hypothetical protein
MIFLPSTISKIPSMLSTLPDPNPKIFKNFPYKSNTCIKMKISNNMGNYLGKLFPNNGVRFSFPMTALKFVSTTLIIPKKLKHTELEILEKFLSFQIKKDKIHG